MNIHTYKDLIVWQKAMNLVIEIYKLTGKFPKEEVYGITNQMRRAAVSMPSNIAEGRLRSSEKEYRQFLLMAFGSGGELETQTEIAKRLQYAKTQEFSKIDNVLSEVMKMLNKMISNLAPNA